MRVAPAAALAVVLAAGAAHAAGIVPPWSEPGDVPIPAWARSVAPVRADTAIAAAPGRPELHRGATHASARLPLFGAKRDAGCGGRWLLVGPLAWICSDAAELSADAPEAMPLRVGEDGLPYRYLFVGSEGAEAYLNLPNEDDARGEGIEAPEEALDPGFSVAVAEERVVRGQKWARTTHRKWIPMRELSPFRPSPFAGVEIAHGELDFGWVTADAALVYAGPAPRGKPAGKHARFDRVAWREERAASGGGGAMVRVSDDGASPAQWMRARDLTRPTLTAPPEAAGDASKAPRWIDVDLGAQVLTAYEGTAPVFATLVSTGRASAETPVGVHRIWVKLVTSDMDNLTAEDDDTASGGGERFSIEDVPFVQFFDAGVALHGAFWHHDFGRPHSHGCVNLAPKDAAWLFHFTGPHLPAGWDAVFPMPLELGTVVSVRAPR